MLYQRCTPSPRRPRSKGLERDVVAGQLVVVGLLQVDAEKTVGDAPGRPRCVAAHIETGNAAVGICWFG